MTFRGVLIGCGYFAGNQIRAWRELADVRIVAVCDLDQDRAKASAELVGARAYSDPEEMLARERPDFADIATTVASHRHLVELSARYCHLVICQKPLAETMADAIAMVEYCETKDVILMVHENFRWQRPFRAVRELLEDGRIGAPHTMHLAFRHGFNIYANQPYLAQLDDVALSDVGPHLFDMARVLMGEADRVSCVSYNLRPGLKGNDAFQALVYHTKGAVSSVECSFYAPFASREFPQTLLRIDGTKGSVEILEGCRVRVQRAGTDNVIDRAPRVPDWGRRGAQLVQDSVSAFQTHVVDVMRCGSEPSPSGRDNLSTLALTFAAAKASREHRVVALGELDNSTE